MTPESIQIAIVESLGWNFYQCGKESATPEMWRAVPPRIEQIVAEHFEKKEHFAVYLPNYPESLDACREFIKIIPDNRKGYFIGCLRGLVSKRLGHFECEITQFEILTAKEIELCEAYLRTIGKWSEE